MKPVKVYHGTCAAFVPAIKREGLKPGHGNGADSWAQSHGHSGIVDRTSHHAPSVYVSTAREFAEEFANVVAEQNQSAPAVLELEIPRDVFAEQFRIDEASTGPMFFLFNDAPKAFRSEKPIPAEWIKHAHRKLHDVHMPV